MDMLNTYIYVHISWAVARGKAVENPFSLLLVCVRLFLLPLVLFVSLAKFTWTTIISLVKKRVLEPN